MAEHPHVPTMTDAYSVDTTSPGGRAVASESRSAPMACSMGHRGLKGLFLMATCCAAPMLLLVALPVLGTVLGGRSTSVVSTLAALACPVGMALMMWMMRRPREGVQQPVPGQPISLFQTAANLGKEDRR